MSMIYFPYGHAEFDSDDLVMHVLQSPRNYIIQGQAMCDRKDHRKPHSLDCWLRDNYASKPDTKQAVDKIIDALLATGDFMEGKFKCPDSKRNCQGIKLSERRLASKRKTSMNYKLNVIIQKDNHGYYAFCPELEGCQSQGDSLEEVLENIREAVELYLETLSEEEIKASLSKEILTTSMEVRVG